MEQKYLYRKPWSGKIPWLQTLAALFGGAAAGCLCFVILFHAWRFLGPAGILLYSYIPFVVAGAVSVLLLGLKKRTGTWRFLPGRIGLRGLPRGFFRSLALWFVVISLGQMSLTLMFEWILTALGVDFPKEQEVFDLLLEGSRSAVAALVLVVVFIAPVLEELFFRRLLFALFLPMGVIPAIALQALLFGAVHFFLLGLPGLIWFGVLFQLYYLKTRSLFAPMLLHAVNNLAAVLIVLFCRMVIT